MNLSGTTPLRSFAWAILIGVSAFIALFYVSFFSMAERERELMQFSARADSKDAGAVEYAASNDHHPAQLRNQVTSPGGTSAAAMYELERGRLRTVLTDAIWAAYRRCVELGSDRDDSQ